MPTTRSQARDRDSLAPSVDETASVVTLHTIPDSALSAPSKGRRTLFAKPGRSRLASTVPSTTPSLAAQDSELVSRPSSLGTYTKPPSSKAPTGVSSNRTSASKTYPKLEQDFETEDEEEFEDEDGYNEPDVTPPKFTIDLSKPPRERYNHVAQHFTPQRVVPEKLFRQLAKEMANLDAESAKKWGRRIFRKLSSAEEQEEIEGIAHVWGVEQFYLVAFNTLLDSLMGCTSGGVRVRDPPTRESDSMETQDDATWDPVESTDPRGRMLHFRTLDWGMEPLRKLVCEYEYVAQSGGAVIARQITYFGFVGVLTGVRKGLSLSLNFRPTHDSSSWWKDLCFRSHQLLVLFGWRQSIGSILRECLLPSKYHPLRILPTLVDLERDMPSKKTTVAYLIFSDGTRTTTMEKDHTTAVVRSASDFIVALNHDVADEIGALASESAMQTMAEDPSRKQPNPEVLNATDMQEIVSASKTRKSCVVDHWKEFKNRRNGPAVQTADVIEWMKDPELSNDETHYTVVMDPARGEFVWKKRWLQPLEPDDPR